MKMSWLISRVISLFVILSLLCLPQYASAGQGGPIGGGSADLLAEISIGQSLAPIATEYGKIKLSIDGVGTVSDAGDIHIMKPIGGTVRKAYLLSATTGFSGYTLSNGDVKVNGNDITWGRSVSNSIYSYNYWADVTNIVKPLIDNAPAGTVNLTIFEQNSYNIDGEILAVIFDDPNQITNSSVILYFGAQNIAGDTFTINMGRPINTGDANLKVSFSMGTSFGCQGDTACGSLGGQHSLVSVNGQRLSTSAGGYDDGELNNGALITVGGIGDLEINPPDPYALAVTTRSDDELYDLKPFIKNNDTTIKIDTYNPSSDDNIFFAALMISSASTIHKINVDISLTGNPTTTEARAPYENIIRYFADGVFESSNGINKIGTVTIHTDGDFANKADIIWKASGHPNSEVAGYDVDGKHINMYEVFKDGSGKGIDYNFMADDSHQENAGYTLAHEFGHLYYSLYDEYACISTSWAQLDCKLNNLFFWLPHSTDKPVHNSMMNSQWNTTLTSANNYNWLNFSIPKNTSGDTAQYRVYGASGWETLARPVSQDPKTPWWSAIPVRLYHSELASVKPGTNEDSRIDLPGTARSELNIIWESASTVASLETNIPYIAELNSILGQNISYPDPIVLEAFVHQDFNITGLNVTGSVYLPDGTTLPVQFVDNGVPPDVLAGDGLYSAILNPSINGNYTVQVNFDNHALNGKLVAYAFNMSTDINGDAIPYPDPLPVTDDFELSKSLVVSMGNVVSDDHANVPDLATEVLSNGLGISGKIEYTGDADVFKITTLSSGYTYIRVTNLAFGMMPHVRVLSSDKETVLYELDLPLIEDTYLNTALKKVQPDTTVYVEVTDASGNFGGLYRFSAGAPLASDTVNNIHVYINEPNMGSYFLPDETARRQSYFGINNGPVQAVSVNDNFIIASQRVIYGGTSYSEMMGLPAEQLTKEYLFPYYNNVAMDSQLRVSNVGGTSTTIKVYLGTTQIDSYILAAGGATRKNYPGKNSGPLRVTSSASDILATVRVLYGGGSYSELMGFPAEQLAKEYLFPYYNNVAMDSQLRVSNVGGASTTITVYLGTTQIDSYILAAGGATRKNYPGRNSGPLRVTSSATDILTTIRVLYGDGSYSELMGFPAGQLGQEYWYPVYDNANLDSQLRVSNVGTDTTHITVYAGGVQIDSYDLGKGAATRKNYPANSGPLQVVSSTQPILTTIRLLYGSSLYEMTGLPDGQLSTQYFFPWYNNKAMDSELRFAVP